MDITDLKRRAGIITEGDFDNYPQSGDGPQVSPDGSDSPEFIATNFINGNQSDAFNAIGGNVALFAQVAMSLGSSDGSEALMNFLQFASRRGQ